MTSKPLADSYLDDVEKENTLIDYEDCIFWPQLIMVLESENYATGPLRSPVGPSSSFSSKLFPVPAPLGTPSTRNRIGSVRSHSAGLGLDRQFHGWPRELEGPLSC